MNLIILLMQSEKCINILIALWLKEHVHFSQIWNILSVLFLVPFQRNRLQWYDSNARRPEVVALNMKSATKRAINVLEQLPITTVCVRKKRTSTLANENDSGDNRPEATFVAFIKI